MRDAGCSRSARRWRSTAKHNLFVALHRFAGDELLDVDLTRADGALYHAFADQSFRLPARR